MTDTSKTAEIIKRWYYSTAHWQLDDVRVSDITFLWFLLFSMCQSLRVAVNKCINWCFVHLQEVQTKSILKASTPPYIFKCTWMQPKSWKTRIPAVAGVCWPWAIPYIRRPASDFRPRKESNFPEWLHAVLFTWRCFIECYNQHRDTIRWVTAVGSNVAFKIAAKSLQIETWLFWQPI